MKALILSLALAHASGTAETRACPFARAGEHSLFCRVSDKIAFHLASEDELREEAIGLYLQSITRDNAEYEAIDSILGDTVMEGDACYEFVRGDITAQCKRELREQVAIERDE
jgi:hypothetical protein